MTILYETCARRIDPIPIHAIWIMQCRYCRESDSIKLYADEFWIEMHGNIPLGGVCLLIESVHNIVMDESDWVCLIYMGYTVERKARLLVCLQQFSIPNAESPLVFVKERALSQPPPPLLSLYLSLSLSRACRLPLVRTLTFFCLCSRYTIIKIPDDKNDHPYYGTCERKQE